MNKNIFIPADVPQNNHKEFQKNFNAITKNTSNLFLFAADQKIEHLNYDFYGEKIPDEVNNPHLIFEIAQQGYSGALATHLGLIARYAKEFLNINYIAKLNGKTHLIDQKNLDPISNQLWTIDDVLNLKKEIPTICGVGYTIYIGSEFESTMLEQATQIIQQAHHHGLVTILWVYARGKSIKNDQEGNLLAGAAGLANALGSDFVKIKPPQPDKKKTSAEWLSIITQAAGNTKVICSGGALEQKEHFLQTLYDQLHSGQTHGCATGRNIFQRPLKEAINMSKAIAAIVYDNASIEKALSFFE